MGKKLILPSFFLLIFFFIFPQKIHAVVTTISNVPSNISYGEFTIDVVISGAAIGTNYLRVDLYKSGTSNYFGETYNGSDWYKESDHGKYLSVTIQSGVDWSGQIQGRAGNPSSAEYDGPGRYKLRIRRYTASGSYNTTEANNSAVDVTINIELSSPAPSEIPSPTGDQSLPSTPTEIVTQTMPPASNSQPQSYTNVYISEVMVDPENGNEWVEVYNGNGFSADLDSWYIDDIENAGSTAKKFSLSINAKSYAVFELSSSIFNNEGDYVRLLDFNQHEIDSFQYQSSEKGKSLGRTSFDDDYFCPQNQSKGSINNPCINPTTTSTTKPTSITNPTLVKTPMQVINPTTHSTPTKKIATPTQFVIFSQNQPIISGSSYEDNINVLGISTKNDASIDSRSHALVSSLSFISFSYAALAILSILLKLKYNPPS
ncbi:lamin tail domain-containing protein [Candidatus Roizmanbacteria bacterium]|nr:lamin tail domain-containing protein [Candidatus Roizmanbacteria bacterium]